MLTPVGSNQIWRFGIYEADPHKVELRRGGAPVKLREQSFLILIYLLEHAGEIVTREELRQVLWPSDTFVDFEHGLNTAMMKLRDALGDSTEAPLYIETIPKHGYRFIAPITRAAYAHNSSANFNGDSELSLADGTSTPPQMVPAAADLQHESQVIPDLVLAFQEHAETLRPDRPLPTTRRNFSFKWLAVGVPIVLLTGFLMGFAVRKFAQRSPAPPVVKAVIKLEPGMWLAGSLTWLQRPSRTAMVISRDGHFIVYSAIAENPGPDAKSQLCLRKTDQSEAKPIAGTEGGVSPFLSPDDRWVGFWTGDKLMKVSVDGGVPVALCNVSWLFGASWALDNTILFANSEHSGIFRVSAEGGEPESLTTPDRVKNELSHRLPYSLPDGKSALFTIMSESFDLHPRTALLNVAQRKWSVLLDDAADARYIPAGYIVFLRQGTLMAVPFDLGRLEVMGKPVPLIANVMQALNFGNSQVNTVAGQFSLSDAGWLVYAEGGIFPDRQNSLVWVDHQGKTEPIASFKSPFFAPRLSPDGLRIAYTTLGREDQVWVYDLKRGTRNRLTREGKAFYADWTPDGKRLVFGWAIEGYDNLFLQPADGSGPPERLTTSDHVQHPGSWSPDGATLAFVEERADKTFDISLLDLKTRRTTVFLNSSASEGYPEFSPDGRWLAYSSEESGRFEVYVRPFPGPGGKWLISQVGGIEPIWARNGKRMYFRSNDDSSVWGVDIQTGAGVSAGKPRLMFNLPGMMGGHPSRAWDVSLDGKRFLMVKLEEVKPTPVTELVFVVDWIQDLQRLAPKAKR